MRDVADELKARRLDSRVSAWSELEAQGTMLSSRGLITPWLEAEPTDRARRSISDPLKAARFPVPRDLAGFDFVQSKVDQHLITEVAHHLVFMGDRERERPSCVNHHPKMTRHQHRIFSS